jgi:hypothetical protein
MNGMKIRSIIFWADQVIFWHYARRILRTVVLLKSEKDFHLNCGVFCAGETGSPENPTGTNDFTSKLLHLAWHPSANLIACAASNSLYMYYA